MSGPFSQLIGNEEAKSGLTRLLQHRFIPHSLLFAGPDGVGKSLFAEAFAKAIINSQMTVHPDIRIYKPEGKIGMHSIDTMRRFSEDVYLPPYSAEKKIFIIHNADRMLTFSANALLKTFEEPAPHSLIILLSSNPEALLPTVRSRCQTVRFHRVSVDEISQLLETKFAKSKEEAKKIAILSDGSLGEAFKTAVSGDDPLRQQMLSILTMGKMSTYSQLMEAVQSISQKIEEAQKLQEESIRESLLKQYPEDLTSAQKQLLDKEIDGILAMELSNEAKKLFDIILGWYRDMNLLQLKGNPQYLLHVDFRDQEEQALHRGDLQSLEIVQKALKQSKLAVERSTPFDSVLECLFLHLNLL